MQWPADFSLLLWTRANLWTVHAYIFFLGFSHFCMHATSALPACTSTATPPSSLFNPSSLPSLRFHFLKNTCLVNKPPQPRSSDRHIDRPARIVLQERMATMKLGSKPEIFVLEGLTWLSRFLPSLKCVHLWYTQVCWFFCNVWPMIYF